MPRPLSPRPKMTGRSRPGWLTERDIMKKEYDFSKGARGKFYRSNAKFNVPVYLDGEVRKVVERIAHGKRTNTGASDRS